MVPRLRRSLLLRGASSILPPEESTRRMPTSPRAEVRRPGHARGPVVANGGKRSVLGKAREFASRTRVTAPRQTGLRCRMKRVALCFIPAERVATASCEDQGNYATVSSELVRKTPCQRAPQPLDIA